MRKTFVLMRSIHYAFAVDGTRPTFTKLPKEATRVTMGDERERERDERMPGL